MYGEKFIPIAWFREKIKKKVAGMNNILHMLHGCEMLCYVGMVHKFL
jgi:hypothetical protein